MVTQPLDGTVFSAGGKLDALRDRLMSDGFQRPDDIRAFINRYLSENPEGVHGRNENVVSELVAGIRAELGLAPASNLGAVSIIPDHVRALLRGQAQASVDTMRMGVHHAANSVAMHSGQFVYDAADVFMDGAGMNFVFRRIYKNQGFHHGPLGINWDHNLNHALRLLPGEQKLVRLTGGFQESAYQWQARHSYWIGPPGDHSVIFDRTSNLPAGVTHLALPPDTAEHRFLLRQPGGTIRLYRREANDPLVFRVARIADRFGCSLDFDYEPGVTGTERIRRVTVNCDRRWVSFAYDSEDRITGLLDHTGRRWSYGYDGLGDLVSFTTPPDDRYKAGLTERYFYSTADRTGALRHNLLQVYDTAQRLYLENEYGTDRGLLSFNRVVRQREGHGERSFEYEDISPTGVPAGLAALEETWPRHQTTMVQRNGHPVHHIYNGFGNLIGREEDVWGGQGRRRLVAHFRYNRDGVPTGEMSPAGRETLTLTGRDQFLIDHRAENLGTGSDLRQHQDMTWLTRLGFGRRLSVVQRDRRAVFAGFQYPDPLGGLASAGGDDIIVKMRYRPRYGQLESVSDPRHTRSPLDNSPSDNTAEYQRNLTRFEYRNDDRLLDRIVYPDTTRDGMPDASGIEERFEAYDAKGRLLSHRDLSGVHWQFAYFTAADGAREGYLRSHTIDPVADNPQGLDLTTAQVVNEVDVATKILLPKGQAVNFDVDPFNRVTRAIRRLPKRQVVDPASGLTVTKPAAVYETRFAYCRNMLVDQIERDIQDDGGRPLAGGTEVQVFKYDANDNVVQRQHGGADPATRRVTGHEYDDGDLRVRTVLPRGNAIRISYDERRLPVRMLRGAGSADESIVGLTYDADGLVSVQTDGRGQKTELIHDAFGRNTALRELDENGRFTRLIRYDHDKAGNLTVERLFVPGGATGYTLIQHVSHAYNELSQRIETRVRRLASPLPCTRATVDRRNEVVPLAEAVRTLVTHDASGRVTRLQKIGRRLDSAGNALTADTVLTWRFGYNAAGWPVSETDPLNNRTVTHYDKHGLVTRTDIHEDVGAASPTGKEVFSVLFGYDDLDRLCRVTDGLGNRSTYEYDGRDDIIRQVDALGNVTHFEQDVFGQRAGERVEMTDNGLGGGARAPNSDIVTRFDYDANGNLVGLVDAHGNTTRQIFDALDRVKALQYPDASQAEFRYDGNENVVWHKDPDGLVRDLHYGRMDELLRVDIDTSQLSPGLAVEGTTFEAFEYDGLGRRTRAQSDGCDIKTTVDGLGRATSETFRCAGLPAPFTIRRDCDDFDFLAGLTYPDGRRVAYSADALNRVLSVEDVIQGPSFPGPPGGTPHRVLWKNQYRGLRLGGRRHGNGSTASFSHDSAGRLIHARHRDAHGDDIFTIEYLYDATGNMRRQSEYMPGGNRGEIYRYDSMGQLTVAITSQPSPIDADRLPLATLTPSGAPLPEAQLDSQVKLIDPLLGALAQPQVQFTFSYDRLGNRREERRLPQPPILFTTNQLNQVTSRGVRQFQYTPSGNRDRETGGTAPRHYAYDHRGGLARVTEAADLAVFGRDALGRNARHENGGAASVCIYDDENLIEEWLVAHGQPPRLAMQIASEPGIDSRLHVAVGGTEYWYHSDLIGSCRALTDPTGEVAQDSAGQELRYRYSPFGELVLPVPELVQPYLFAGRRFDATLGTYDFRARQYAPDCGTFLQRDCGGERMQVHDYIYASNNPLTWIDPEGDDDRPKTALGTVKSILRGIAEFGNILGRGFFDPQTTIERLGGAMQRVYRTRGGGARGAVATGLWLTPPVQIFEAAKQAKRSVASGDVQSSTRDILSSVFVTGTSVIPAARLIRGARGTPRMSAHPPASAADAPPLTGGPSHPIVLYRVQPATPGAVRGGAYLRTLEDGYSMAKALRNVRRLEGKIFDPRTPNERVVKYLENAQAGGQSSPFISTSSSRAYALYNLYHLRARGPAELLTIRGPQGAALNFEAAFRAIGGRRNAARSKDRLMQEHGLPDIVLPEAGTSAYGFEIIGRRQFPARKLGGKP